MSAVEKKERPVAIDLFAGCGGLSLGFEQAGFDIAAAAHFAVPRNVIARRIRRNARPRGEKPWLPHLLEQLQA